MIYLIILLGLILRLPLLGGSFWLDEAAQFLESARPLAQQFDIREDFQPPLMHLITFFGIRLGNWFGLGESEWWLRFLPSLLPGLLTIWATYRLGLKLFSKKIALLASFLLATSSFHIFYSQELRPYSLPALWAILATWQLLELLESKKIKAKIFFIIFSILGLYSSYLYPFLLIAQFIYLWQKKFNRQKMLLLATSIGLGFLPWLPKFFEQLQTGQALRKSMPGWEQVVSLPQIKTAVLLPLKFVFGLSDLELNLGYVFLSLAVFVPLAYFIFLARQKERPALLFFFYLLALPLLLSWLVSFFVPVLQAKRVLFALPLFCLLEAFLLVSYQKSKPHLSKIFFTAVVTINLFSTYAYWTKPQLQREDWRGLSQEISQKFNQDNTAVLFAFDQPFAPWRVYDQTGFKTFSTGVFYANDLENPHEIFKEASQYQYILVFDYLRDLTDPDNLLLKVVQDLGFTPVSVLDYPNIGFVRIYSRSPIKS